MPDGRLLRIPPAHIAPFRELAGLPSDDLKAIRDAIASAAEGATPPDLAEAVRKAQPSLAPSAQGFVDALMSLSVLRSAQGWTLRETAEALASSTDLELPTDEQSGFAERIADVLAARPLWHAAKAYDLGTAFVRSLQSGRIITDVRPVFDDDPADRPGSAVITHSLILRTYNDDGQQKTFYITLDEEDLRSLKTQTERALDKLATLRGLLDEMHIAVQRLEKA
jgi:hypothetical protein